MNPRENTTSGKPDEKPDQKPDPTEDLIDAEVEMTFPASDPPSYMGGAAVAGPPPKKERGEGVVTEASDPHAVKPEKPDTQQDYDDAAKHGGP